MEQILDIISRFRKVVVFVIVAIPIVIIALFAAFALQKAAQQQSTKDQIKQSIAQNIDRQDFTIKEVFVESGGWYLAGIISTAKQDEGNNGLAILQKQNNKLVLKFGPGTRFERADLNKAGVPTALMNYLYKDSYGTNPILDYLPYQTDACQALFAYQGGEDSLTALTVVPKYGVHATAQEVANCFADTKAWIQSNGLDPKDYKLIRGY